jgi:acyl-CoA synthetase (AMP-forming)/AMP-acid ligase II
MTSADHGAAGAEPGIDLPSWIRSVVTIDPGADALEFEGTWRPWRHLASGIEALDGALSPASGEGTAVGVVIRNRPEIVRTIVGVLGTGRCLVTLSSAVPTASLAAEVRRLGLPVIVASATDWTDELRAAAGDAGTLGLSIGDGDAPAEVVMPGGAQSPGSGSLRPGVAVQMLTSGTTGTPKRVDLLYRSIEHELVSTAHYSSSGSLGKPRLSSGVAIIWNPLLHIGGLRGLITNLVAGRRIAMLERFSVPAWAALVEEHRPRVLALVPSALRMVLDADVPKEVLASAQVVISGTAPLAPELGAAFEAKYGIPVLVVYGATEFAGGVAGWTLRDWRQFGAAKRGSVGRVNRGVEARVVDQESGEPLANGDVGLLEVRGPQLAQPGWLRTTDLARIDDEGFIWIEGRADDVIIRGGFKVATGAVSEVLRKHPAVLDACVIGVPDERLGQVPVAAVELRPDVSLDAEALKAWARDQLSPYQVPVRVIVAHVLPRTPSMKVSQPEVRRLFEATER